MDEQMGIDPKFDDTRAKTNSLILKIYSQPKDNLLLACCDDLRKIIPFDHSFTSFNDERDLVGSTFNYLSNDTDEELLSLYANRYCKIDYLSWFYNQRQPATLRATDLVYPEVIERSRIHAEWESRMGIFYTAIACIAANDIIYGTISLMRSKERGDFTDKEVRALDEINQHLCNRFALTYPHGISRSMVDASIDPIASAFSFTHREWEIVCLLIRGFSRASIADELCISGNTLKHHMANIYRKMDVSNAQQFFATLGQVGVTLHSPGSPSA